MEQSIPPWTYSAAPRPGTSAAAGTALMGDDSGIGGGNGSRTGMNSESSMSSEDCHRSSSSQQELILQEYNRLAEKHGLRPLLFGMHGSAGPDGQPDQSDLSSQESDRRNWFARAFGKPTTASPRRSSRHSIGSRSERSSKHRRSESEGDRTTLPQFIQSLQASQGLPGSKPDATDTLKNQSLETLVRICGKSYLYLPAEQSTRSLMLPTCFRAAAQHLVQNGPETRGIFRISGSMRVVNELYDYYCINVEDDESISTTVRAPNLPFHIKCSVHDVASMFKRLLSGLPAGILGYLGLFDALVDILKLDSADDSVGNQSKARLIALAVGSVPEILQRELICAVFGLLSLIGAAAEAEPAASGPATPGSSLPHSEKMGFAALGIIFGPLLVGDQLSSYYLPDSSIGSSILLPPVGSQPGTPSPRSKRDDVRKSIASDRNAPSSLPSALDKIFLANDVAQMVISNWQGAVSQMRQIGIMRKESMLQQTKQKRPESLPRALRPTKSDTFAGLNMGAMINQASQGYNSNLRKARSASNNRKQNGSTGQSLPPDDQIRTDSGNVHLHNLPSQRPSDMTFEEFAARKKLRSQTSNMSIASDSTYSAITPQPVRPLSPQSEDPFYVPDQKTTSSRFAVAKLTKQRRLSGGISSLFGDKSGSPTKPSPKIARKALPSSGESQATPPRKRSGTISSAWGVSLSPVKPKKTADSGVKDQSNAPSLPMPITPKNSRRQNLDPKLCRSEPAGRVGVAVTPQSKTAALIAKIINTKPQDTPAQKTPTRKPRPADTPRTGVMRKGVSQEKLGAQVVSSKFASGTAVASQQPKDQSVAVDIDCVAQASSSSLTLATKENENDPTHLGGSRTVRSTVPENAGRSPRPPRQTNSASTPQRRPETSVHKSDEGSRSQSRKAPQVDTRIRDTKQAATDPVPASPLMEIRNDARVKARPQTGTSGVAASRLKSKLEDSPIKLERNSPSAKSSVRAMAAMFDGTPWNYSEFPIKVQAQTGRPKGPAMPEYTSNTPGMKITRPVTPTRPLSTQIRDVFDGKEASKTDSASLQEMASERRRLRLSKSEDRSARLVRAHHHLADASKDVRSVDRKNNAGLNRPKPNASQSPSHLAQINRPPRPQSPSDRHMRVKPALSSNQSAVPAVPPITGKIAMLSSGNDKNGTSKLQELLDSKSTECEKWQTRAEAAERRVAELELLLSLSGVSDKTRGSGSYTIREDEEDGQSWSWQDLLPEPTPIGRLGERLGEAADNPRRRSSAASTEGRGGPLLRKESRRVLGRGSTKDTNRSTDANDGYVSDSSTTTVVVHGRLANERLKPFL